MNAPLKRSVSGEAREVYLAAFGKHPGWEDHLPGIGLETELLARIKQTFYVSGIGGQVDAGAWEKLDAAKRLDGFDHSFLFSFGRQILLGTLWSSTDRLGRAKYPMVLTAQFSGFFPAEAWRLGWPVLEQLRERCRGFKTADEVKQACGSALADLRGAVRLADTASGETQTPREMRARFLASPALGLNQVGFLRIFHELGAGETVSAPGKKLFSETATLPGKFSRLPDPLLGADRTALVVWGEFLPCALPDSTPLWLLHRAGQPWVDAIAGEPAGQEFFCLQASPQLLPLATDVPYDLPAALAGQFAAAAARYLNPDAPASAPGAKSEPVAGGSMNKWVLVVVSVLILVGGGFVWFALRPPAPGEPQKTPLVETPTPTNPVTNTPVTPVPPPDLSAQPYADALKAARTALAGQDFSGAIAQANKALELRVGDAAAMQIKADAERQQQAIAADTARLQNNLDYSNALKVAQAALDSKDYTNAIAQAGKLLLLRAGDEAALQIKAKAELQQKAEADAQQALLIQATADHAYTNALKAAQVALDSKDYNTAIAQADMALALRPQSPEPTELKNQAASRQQAALVADESQHQQDKDYTNAITAAQAAMGVKDYATALTQAQDALVKRPGDPVATKVMFDAQTQQAAAIAAAKTDADFTNALTAAEAALDKKDYVTALTQAGIALQLRPGQATVLQLQKDALAQQQAEQAAQAAAQVRAVSDLAYTNAMRAAQSALQTTNFTLADTQAAQALALRPGDADALRLKTLAQTRREAAARLSVRNVRDELETHMECLEVRFGVLDPKEAKHVAARQTPVLQGQLSLPDREAYGNEIQQLIKDFKQGGWLTPELKKKLNGLNDMVNSD